MASGPSVAQVLVGLGGLSLVAAVVVFTAVTWTDLAAWVQGGLLVGATAGVLGAAVACRRRGLGATAEALAAVATALAVADVHVVRMGLDAVATPRAVWTAGLALVAGGAWVVGHRTGLRTLALAGAALGFLPAGVAAQGASSASVLVTVLGAQALVATVLLDHLGGRHLGRGVVATGAAASWVLAAGGGLVLAGAGLAHDPMRSPTGAAVLLALLAAGSVLVGRRHAPALATAGSALAFVPALVAAVGTGEGLPVVAVLAVEGVAASVAAVRLRLAPGGRAVLVVGGLMTWASAAVGGVLVGAAALVDRPGAVPLGAVLVLAGLAAASIVVGRLGRVDGLTGAGVGLAFVPALLAAGAAGTTVVVGILLAEAVAGLVVSVTAGDPTDATGAVRTAGAVARCGALTAWLVATTGAAGLGVDALDGSGPTTPTAVVALLLGLSATALAAGLVGGGQRDATGATLIGAIATLLGAVAVAAAPSGAEVVTSAVALTAGALALGLAPLVALDRDRPWTVPLVGAGATVTVLALVPLWAVVAVLAALADTATSAGTGSAGQSLVDRLAPSSALAVEGALPTVTTLLQLASVALLGGALWTLRRRAGVALLTAVGVAVAVVLPVVGDLTVGTTALGLGLLVAAGAVVLAGRPDEPTVLAAEAVLVPLLLAVAVASAPLAVAATVLVTVLVTALAARAVGAAAGSAPVWVGGALACLFGSVVLDSTLLGATGSGPALALALAAAIASAAAPALERWAPGGRAAGAVRAADAVVAGGLTLALASTQSLDAASAVVGGIAVVAGGAALRPSRRALWMVSLAAAVMAVWMRLASASVEVVEAYTLPLAAALLAIGLLVRRGEARSSWERAGAALIVLLAPSAVLAVTELDPTRTVAVVLAAVAVTLWGAVRREQAPLALGGAAVAAVALRHLGPVAADLPRWTVLAAAGVVLLAAGATFEQRRRDLRVARDAFSRLS